MEDMLCTLEWGLGAGVDHVIPNINSEMDQGHVMIRLYKTQKNADVALSIILVRVYEFNEKLLHCRNRSSSSNALF